MLKELPLTDGGVVQFRSLSAAWLERGYLDVLSQLSPCELAVAAAQRILLAQIQYNGQGLTPVAGLLVDRQTPAPGRVVACGTLLVEQKFVHGGGKVGHIEDVVVERTLRGQGIGQALVELLVELAHHHGCYKVVLSCREGAEAFYEACGFRRFEIEMRRDLPSP